MNRILRALIIFGCLLSAEIGWAFNGTVSTTSIALGSQINVTVTNTDNSEKITITVTNAPTTPSPAPTSPSPAPTTPSPATNTPPVLAPIGNKTVQAGTTLSFPINAYADSPITFNATNLPTGAICNPAVSTILPGGMMTWGVGGAPAFSWTPTSSQVGSYTVTFTVSDSQGGTASETITITVNAGATATPGTSVNPASAALASFQYTVAGNAVTLIFGLTAPAATDMPVSLTVTPTPSGPGGFPASVTIPAGVTNYQTPVFVAPEGNFTLTASAGGVSRTVTLQLP